MKKIMIKKCLSFCGALFLVMNAANSLAKTWVEGAAECLGPTMPFELYEEPIMRAIQGNLEIVYHKDPQWLVDFQKPTLNGAALSDGRMGRITWDWMNRFCGDFWLPLSQDALEELPAHLERIAGFAKLHPRELSVLISPKFFNWLKSQPDADAIKKILMIGNEQQLLALVVRYEGVPTVPTPKVAVVKEAASSNNLYRYVLREDDFESFASPTAASTDAGDLSETFDSPEKLKAGITKVIAKLSPERQQTANVLLQTALAKPEIVYQLTEAKLSALDQGGLTAFEFVELSKIGDQVFSDSGVFEIKVIEALNKAASNLQSLSATSSLSSQSVSSAAASSADDDSLISADKERTKQRVLNIAKGYRLSEQTVKQLADSNTSLDAVIVKVIKPLQDREYPDGELLHSAVRDKLAQALNLCDENESISLDIEAPVFSEKERESLRHLFSQTQFKVTDSDKVSGVCDDNFWVGLKSDYRKLLEHAISEKYQEPMPAYEGNDIQWNGDECGCIPDEIKATAYGIYPYWGMDKDSPYSADKKPLNFDFSTFSRVGYYGFSFNSLGELTQPGFDKAADKNNNKPANKQEQGAPAKNGASNNQANIAKELFNIKSQANRDFISVARKFGSKVDWVIEKDWSEESSNPSHVQEVLNNLQKNVIHLLEAKLDTWGEFWRPAYTLGIAKPPTLGDGVTFYFKNYPTDPASRDAFVKFFTELKDNLRKTSARKNRLFREKQDFFVNLIVDQDDYLNANHLFYSASIFNMIKVPYAELTNKTALAEQELTQTLVLVLIKNPYFNSLQTLFSSSTATQRGYVIPTVVMGYENFSTGVHARNGDKRSFYDERRKVVSFQRETFGGGGYWYLPTWDAGATAFNHYIADNFALDYPVNSWYSTICAYRWLLVGIMNLWLIVALSFVLLVFYIYPHRCHELPAIVAMMIRPLVLLLIIAPPFILWAYLKTMDSQFPWISLSSLLLLVLFALTLLAGIDWINRLSEQKPSRNLAQLEAANASLPKRQQIPQASSEQINDDEKDG